MSASKISYLNLKTCRYLLKFGYIGTRYKGVQRQTRRLENENFNYEDGTIQCAIENALDRALYPVYGSRLGLSSRTDTGVHAFQNTANVDLTHPLDDTIYKPSFITDATNRVLSFYDHEISIIETRLVPVFFHSRINAKWRSYVYRVAVVRQSESHGKFSRKTEYQNLRRFLPVSHINRCHVVGPIDLDLAEKCMQMLRGEHDFASFSTKSTEKEKPTIKFIDKFEMNKVEYSLPFESAANCSSSLVEFYEFYIKSSSFLYNQIRRMISAVIDVGLGRLSLTDIEHMLQTRFYRHPAASQMVPACGLYLVEVGYDSNDFVINDSSQVIYAPKAYYREDSFDLDSDLDE